MTYRLLALLISFTGLTTQNELSAQTKNQNFYFQIINKFENWKLLQFKSGNFATAKNCNSDTVTKEGYKGSEMGIPNDIEVSFTDINNDNKIDGLITFYPDQCDGGNALMNAQIWVLVLSSGASYMVDDSYISNIENRFKKGWFGIQRATEGTIDGTYYECKEDDGRCCPSIVRPFSIDYKTKKLAFKDGK